jgi:hypothetical protein
MWVQSSRVKSWNTVRSAWGKVLKLAYEEGKVVKLGRVVRVKVGGE